MMNFINAKIALEDLLRSNAGTSFKVIGQQRQSIDADSITALDRTVQVYAKGGDFPRGGGTLNGSIDHELTLNIELKVAAEATGDLSVLNDQNSDDADRKSALDNFVQATKNADDSFDELISLVWNIVMDARNQYFGDPTRPLYISNRWAPSWSKDEPLERGQYAVITGILIINCRVCEDVTGAPVIEGAKQIQTTLQQINNDTIQQTETITPAQ